MKRSIARLIVLSIIVTPAICLGAVSAGPSVFLSNVDANHPIYYETVGNPAAGPDFFVEILGGPDAQHLGPVTVWNRDASVFNIGTGVAGPGFFDGAIGIVPGFPGIGPVQATFQVLAWKGASTFESSSQRVSSATWTQMTAFTDSPPGMPVGLPLEFPANLVIPAIPEPPTLVLLLLGSAGVLASRWRREIEKPLKPIGGEA